MEQLHVCSTGYLLPLLIEAHQAQGSSVRRKTCHVPNIATPLYDNSICTNTASE